MADCSLTLLSPPYALLRPASRLARIRCGTGAPTPAAL